MKTYHSKPAEIERKWYIVDAEDLILGRIATKIATVLRGKHKAIFSPHLDTGDFVVVVNAEKVRLTGKKEQQKTYFRHTGYPGGEIFTKVAQVRAQHPERIIEHAVKGMLPRGPLGRRQFRKLKVYAGPDHPHEAQHPEPLNA
ncbi:50S ribosomal protein L13 [candidate division LCP-89 bacterium B3_LCP]|uniref:Large ribosomal subunit protein uL13 n=1 Tax=candidate division LCP-89 bacterium B3_LCP TaxID=2012998 RepID=A0A532UYH6_UNCL8|nr:MAG: 50S ribosomal protein L13 [candidate division LCP-89 bacterium B3_LCP]